MSHPVLALYWQHMRPYRWRVFTVFILVGVNSSVWAITPIYYKRIFDALTNMSKVGVWDWSRLTPSLMAILILYVGSWIFWRISGFMACDTQPRIAADLQNTAFANILRHSYRFFTEEPAGSLVKRASRFVDAFYAIAEPLLWRLFPAVIVIATMLVVVWGMEWGLGLLLLIWVLVFLVSDVLVSRWKLPFDEHRSNMDSKASGLLTDAVTNAVTVKLFASTPRELAAYRHISDEQRRAQTKSWSMFEVSMSVQGFLLMVTEFSIMGWAIYRFTQGQFSIGALALLQSYVALLFNQMWDIGRLIRTVYEQLANAKEMAEIICLKTEVKDAPKAKRLDVSGTAIAFDRVTFAYNKKAEVGVLRNISLSIASGEKIALVGSSGAGKSTIIRLLLRLFDVSSGRILIDGQDIAKVTQESLRANIALVPQDPLLFHRSLKDNIRYGRAQATYQEVIKAAKQAHCHEFISALPEGYDSLVGERGVKLSGGERQRVAVARAILMNAPILVLDEATSSLDSESEALIQDALKQLMCGKTVIAIAHRLSTIMQMDRMIVMQGGHVVDEGTHHDLLTRDGLYKSLWSIQAGGFLK